MPRLIVSLTSYPLRINGVYKTIETIVNQTLKPDLVVLWLGEDEFIDSKTNVPNDLLKLINCNFRIEWIKKTYGSYDKLIPSLEKFPNDIIVTADDDVLYGENWLETLFKEYEKNPQYIHVHRCHRILFDDVGNLKPYNKWTENIKYNETKPSYLNFFTGVGGVLYPPNSLHKYVLNYKLFSKLCPTGDDIWFWAMALLKGTKINLVKNRLGHPEFNKSVSQEMALGKINCTKNFNDQQIKNVIEYYPKLREILKNEFENSIEYKNFELFDFINVLSIMKYHNCTLISILKYIPIIKVKRKLHKTYIKLFGFIPLLKIVNRTK